MKRTKIDAVEMIQMTGLGWGVDKCVEKPGPMIRLYLIVKNKLQLTHHLPGE